MKGWKVKMKEKTLDKKSLQGTFYVLLSAISFSTGGVLIKAIPWNSFSISMARSLLAFGVIFLYQRSQRRKFVFNKTVLFGALCNTVMAVSFVMATKLTTAANAIVLQFTEPVFLILIVWLIYRQKPGKDAVITCMLVLCGIFCFFYESLSTGGMAGNLLAILSGFTYAGVFLIKKMPGGDFESSLLVSNVISTVIGIPFFAKESVFSPTILVCVVLLGIVQFGLSYIFLSKGLDRVSPVTASLTSTIEPILNPILVAIFFEEKIGMLSLVGAVLVIGAATVYNLRQACPHREPAVFRSR